jgi:hypothetical protein
MKITICGSLDFTYEIQKLAEKLGKKGHQVTIPISSQKIIKGEITLETIIKEKENDSLFKRAIEYNVIREYFNVIKKSDAILIANYNKNNIKNYIGGNTFLEMGFAHILNKTIYLLNDIPKMSYTSEIKVMQPIVIKNNLSKIN